MSTVRAELIAETGRVLAHAPFGRDAEVIARVLSRAGLAIETFAGIDALIEQISPGAGTLLFADESLNPDTVRRLELILAAQPPWSDLPVIILTAGGESTWESRRRAAMLEPLGNVTLLERPLRIETIVSAVRSALRARQRQFRVRDHMEAERRAVDALRESELRFRIMADSAPVLIWMAGPDLGGAFFNRPWLDFTGRALPQELGDGWMNSVHPGDAAALETRRLASAQRVPFTVQFRLRRHDGVFRWFLDTGVPRFAPDGEFLGYIGSCVDITGAKESEEHTRALSLELERRVRDFEALFEFMPVGVAVGEAPASRSIRMNPALSEMLGLPPGAALAYDGLNASPYRFLRDDKPVAPADLPPQIVAQTGQPLRNVELDIERPDGSRVHIFGHATPLKDDAGHVRGSIGAFVDVSDRVRAEAAVRESEVRFRTMADSAPVKIRITDAQGQCTYLSRRWRWVTGKQNDEGLGDGWLDAIHPADREPMRQTFQNAVALRKPYSAEYRLRRYDGVYRWVIDTATPHYSQDGAFAGHIASVLDITERKRAEEILRQSELHLRSIADSIPHLVWMAAPDGHIFWYNQRWYSYTGTTLEEMQGWGWQSVQDPEMLPSVLERWRQSLATGQPFEMEYPIRGANGKFRWFLTRATPLRDVEGRVTRWLGANTDIEDLRQTREALRESEERFRTMANSAPVLIWTSGPDRRVTFFNQPWLKFTGRTLEQELANGRSDCIHPDDRERCLAVYRDHFERREPLRLEYRLRRHDGEYRWIADEAAPRLSPSGEFLGFIGSCNDITDRRAAEETLRDLNRRLELLAANANDMLAHDDPRQLLSRLFARLATYCNLETCFSFWVDEDRSRLRLAFASGIPEDALENLHTLNFGQAVCGTVAAERRPITVQNVLETEEPLTALIRSLGIQAYCCHPLIAGGKLLGTLSFGTRSRRTFSTEEIDLMRAVSDQVAAALERILLVRRLEENNVGLTKANRELEEFAYVASHDLQEPLRMVNIYTQLILRDLPSENPVLNEYAGYVHSGVRRMEQLIQDLLRFSRTVQADTDDKPLELSTDLNDAFSQALGDLQGRIQETQAQLIIDPLPRVTGDPAQLALVFQNLIGNALKYSRAGIVPCIKVTARGEGDTWIIAVEDNGIGFDQRYAERIFGLFKRLHKDEYPGTGLGLAICRRIVERYGGRIWAEGRPNEGATFYLSLPAPQQ